MQHIKNKPGFYSNDNFSRMKIIFTFLLLCTSSRLALSSNFNGSLILSSHSDEPTEGDTVELTCNITLISLPTTNGSKLQYSWNICTWFECFDIYGGRGVDHDGHRVSGYSFKDYGRTLVIDSVRTHDKHLSCRGNEEGETFDDYYDYGESFATCLQIRHKPFIRPWEPMSKKLKARTNNLVKLEFWCEAYPPRSPKGTWTFVDYKGVSKNLPPNSNIGFEESSCMGYCKITFNLTSIEYYGNYSLTVTNDMGSATDTIEVLPEASSPPEAPLNVRIKNVTHNSIEVECNLMRWPYSKSCLPVVFWQLSRAECGDIVEAWNTLYDCTVQDLTNRYAFSKNIKPETNYKVKVWTRNKFGQSKAVEIEVETQKDPNSTLRAEAEVLTTEPIPANKTAAIGNYMYPSILLCLSILLGITSAALIAVLLLVAYLLRRMKQNRQPSQIAMQEVSAGSLQQMLMSSMEKDSLKD